MQILLERLKVRFSKQPVAVQARLQPLSKQYISACVRVIFEAVSIVEVLQQVENV